MDAISSLRHVPTLPLTAAAPAAGPRDVFTPSPAASTAAPAPLGPPPRDPALVLAMRKLEQDGWRFETFHRQTRTPIAVDARGAHDFLTDDSTARDRFYGDGQGDRSHLVVSHPGLGVSHRVRSAPQVAALDFFAGSGDASGLKDPQLAGKLADLEKRGIGVRPSDDGGMHGAWGAYLSMQDGRDCYLHIEGFTFAHVIGQRAEDVEKALEPFRDALDAYETKLVPEAAAGRLDQKQLGSVFQTLGWDVPQVSAGDRTDAFLRIAAAMRGGSVEDRTRDAVRAYEGLLDNAKDAATFQERLPVVVELAHGMPPADVKGACRYVLQDIPAASPFPEARAEKEAIFRRVAHTGLPLEQAVQATEQIAMRPWSEPIEDRVEAFDALAAAAAEQSGYDGLLQDFQCVLRYRAPGQSARDAASSYLGLLRTLSPRGEARYAAPTYVFLQEALRTGRLAVQSIDDLVARFARSYVYTGDVTAARERLLATVPVLDPTIQRGVEEVRIGGVKVPVRRS